VEDLRPYCPAKYLERFDELARQQVEIRTAFQSSFATRRSAVGQVAEVGTDDDNDGVADFRHNWQTEGHHDVHARLRDMDFDGIAAEVIFHGSQNGEPLPFLPPVSGFFDEGDMDPELASVGIRIYNRWLADVCSVQPERHVGLAQVPIWDVDAAVAEVEWAREAGLAGVNFPTPRSGIPEYNDRVWEPFWAACQACGMPLTTHSGAGKLSSYFGLEMGALLDLESGGWPCRRGMIRLIFGGVFERYPSLKLVLTEQPGEWWPYSMREFDSAYLASLPASRPQVPRRPSEYCATNVFIGGSFLSPAEAESAIHGGYSANLMWGSDYPHMEGTFQYPASWDEEPMTRLALRYTFAGVAAEEKRGILSDNAIGVYGFDGPALAQIAERIGAPTNSDLDQPLTDVPVPHGKFAFRRDGPWH
jgi:predicted TIM-barrel fold metal-dependent hydrolase